MKPVFKNYAQHQAALLPPSLDELIAPAHPVRTINRIIDGLDIDPLIKKYKGGGTSSYHPRMMLKVVVYAYVSNIYSSRKMEEACRANIHFMWLAAMQTPDHNSLNRFRSTRLQDVLRTIFRQVVLLLADEGLLSLKELYTDGTKIESAANRYTFVWAKAIQTNKAKISQQLDALWAYAQQVAADELDAPEPPDFSGAEITAEKVAETVERIDAALRDKPEASKAVKDKLKYAKKNWPQTLEKYAAQEQILAGRGSYSKTDPDATFMRMKEDHMQNGQLKPGYNIQVSSSNQYVVDYTVHQAPTDTITLVPHLDQLREDYAIQPQELTADAGYGSEQNYEALEQRGITAYVKYGSFDRDQHETTGGKKPFSADKLYYHESGDYFICPMGQRMENAGTEQRKTATGFKQTITRYRNRSCEGCPLRGACHKAKGVRTLEVNWNLDRHRKRAQELLTSERGIHHRKKRPVDTEPVFGNMKSNHGFRRFLLCGKRKVEVEVGLLSLAQNLRKKAA